MIKISKYNECFLEITGDREDLLTIREFFTVYSPNYLWHPKYQSGQWDGKIRLYNSVRSTLPFGLYNKLFQCIEENNIEYFVSQELQEEFDGGDFDEELFQEILDNFNTNKIKRDIEARDYQIEAAKIALTMRRGQLHHATSSGKTFTLYLILAYLLRKNPNEKIMVVVPTIGLVKQFVSDYKEFGVDTDSVVGKYYGAEKDLTKPIVVGTWQSLQKTGDFLRTVTMVVGDENHQSKAVNIKALMELCTNAKIRIGMSGSQHENECDRLTVEGNFGPILSVVSAKELMDKGYISSIQVFQLLFHYRDDVRKGIRTIKKQMGGRKAYEEEKDIIQASARRRRLVSKIIEKRGPKENILLLFDELEFGGSIRDYLETQFPDRTVYYIAGSVKADERELIRLNANQEEGVIIVASLGTFSTGINLPKLHSIIALWMGQSYIRLQQSIGRGLRKHITKEKLRFYDIVDQLPYSEKHGIRRLHLYIREGFPVSTHEIGMGINN